jgi:hypothetical protein
VFCGIIRLEYLRKRNLLKSNILSFFNFVYFVIIETKPNNIVMRTHHSKQVKHRRLFVDCLEILDPCHFRMNNISFP